MTTEHEEGQGEFNQQAGTDAALERRHGAGSVTQLQWRGHFLQLVHQRSRQRE